MPFTRHDLTSLSPDAFEQLIAQLLIAAGFSNVVSLGGSGDEGIDLRAEWLEHLPTGDVRMTVWAVQCKRYTNALSQDEVRRILNAAIEPPRDLLPARPDFFLIATSSTLSPNSRRLVERANNERTKYGCTFMVWDGSVIADKLERYREVRERFFTPAPVPPNSVTPKLLIRLSVFMDRIGDQVLLSFVCDAGDSGPTCQMGRSYLTVDAFNELVRKAQDLASGHIWHTTNAEEALKQVGEAIAAAIPDTIRHTLFTTASAYVRLASNVHEIPFELAYDRNADRFLADTLRIGRIHVSDIPQLSFARGAPSILVIGAGTPIDASPLPMVEREVRDLSEILSGSGIPVTILSGDNATRANLAKKLSDSDYTVIHFAGHGGATDDGGVIFLSDGVLPLDQLLPRNVSGSIVFLSSCWPGNEMRTTAEHLFARGVSAMVGFVALIEDRAATRLASKFYETIRNGECLGDALHAARQYQRMNWPNNFSWTSLVLFGDPTATVAQFVVTQHSN